MSDQINNVIQSISPVTDRQSAANPIFNPNSVGIFNTNIINQNILIPPPPPAAFQLQPKLNPAAPSFTPISNSFIQSVQGYKDKDAISNQLGVFQKQLQDSLAKLQILSLQLNALQIVNQQTPSIDVLNQYQNVYQQYNLEFSNTLLLNQCINSLNTLMFTNTNNSTSNESDDNNSTKAAGARLETIEEGEEEAQSQDDEVAPIAGICCGSIPKNDDEGIHKITGEQFTDELHKNVANFEKFHTTTNSETNYRSNTSRSTDTMKQFGETDDHKESELDKIKRQIRGILNKMTAENFDKLSQEMASILKVADIAFVELSKNNKKAMLSREEMKIAQKAQFKALIKLILRCILERALSDIIFTKQYARLCYSLYLYTEHDDALNDLKKKLLRSQLLSLCHSIFKKARDTQDKGRFIGIITMIGELFRYGLISWNVILSGIFDELLPPQTPLDIEAVCKLLKTAGHDFDRHHYNEIDIIVDQLAKYGPEYDFRTRCFVKEIQEIRGNDWKQKNRNKTAPQQSTRWRSNNHRGQRWKPANSYNNNRYRKRSRAKTRPTVEFIRDVTLPDRSHYAPNKILTKTWQMRNSGDVAWGDNVELVYFKGDEDLSVEHRYPVMNVSAGHDVDISATIKTPLRPGRYCTYFRLQKNGKFFGPRVWVDIIVNDRTQSTVANPYVAENKLTKSEANQNYGSVH